MNSSRQFLLGLLVLGWQAALAAAQTTATILPPPGAFATASPDQATGPSLGCPTEPCSGPSGSNCSNCANCSCPSGFASCAMCSNGSNCSNGSSGWDWSTCWNCLGCPCCSNCAKGLVGGVGVYIIQPYFSDNMAYALQTTVGRSSGAIPPGSPGVRADARIDINHQMGVAPLVWLGYIGEDGLGGRVRWWTFDQGTDQSAPLSGGTANNGTVAVSAAPLGLGLASGQGMNVTSNLRLQVADLEALNAIQAGAWNLLFAGGLRIARVSQAYNAFIPQSGANALYSSNTFEGAGPTLALELRHALGGWGLSLYGSARGSLVFGSAHQFATDQGTNTTDGSTFPQAAADHRDQALPIGELELGLEYGRNVGQSRLFGQLALVGQQWFSAGSASRSSINAIPGGNVTGGAYVGNSDLDFLGLSIRFGVNY